MQAPLRGAPPRTISQLGGACGGVPGATLAFAEATIHRRGSGDGGGPDPGHRFWDSEAADIAFASNLLGIMAGGTLEYFALLWGYRSLLLIALALYLIAALLGESFRGRLLPSRVWRPA